MENKLTKDEFLKKLKTDKEFNNKFGRKSTQEGKMALPPCHWAFELYTEELTSQERWALCNNEFDVEDPNLYEKLDRSGIPKRRLHLKWHQRSVDTFLGLPFNIASYAMLLHMFAQCTNMVPGTLVGDLTNVHIYDNHMEYVKKQLDRDVTKYPTPTLKLNNEDDHSVRMGKLLEIHPETRTSSENVFRLFERFNIPKKRDIFNYEFEDFEIENYEYYPNWKDVPIAV